jgi:hypothetical protein
MLNVALVLPPAVEAPSRTCHSKYSPPKIGIPVWNRIFEKA